MNPTSQYNESALNPSGRFGRLSYLGWNGLLCISMMLIIILIAIGLPGLQTPDQRLPTSAILFLSFVYMCALYFSFIFAIRRLHDCNHSGWLSLLMLIPLINLGLTVYLAFAKGNEHENQFGLPRTTKTWEKVLAWFYVLIFPLALVAAIAVPAYQDYVTRAQQVQME
ncbi:hypothetical protein AY606_11610 [Acinetobacter sp. SFB]|uniref:DUF805 domain-containing protein n=1 Tax=Acinetobacter sp. SFB TaxID=1805634 RepID=UPI0007D7CBD1|nr:DUF805 domain-containing protein [Acinetobacter sp. SFB]OAL77327.1 hypothetical protein AY606_11610 [Acinetobacter sp. SFB]